MTSTWTLVGTLSNPNTAFTLINNERTVILPIEAYDDILTIPVYRLLAGVLTITQTLDLSSIFSSTGYDASNVHADMNAEGSFLVISASNDDDNLYALFTWNSTTHRFDLDEILTHENGQLGLSDVSVNGNGTMFVAGNSTDAILYTYVKSGLSWSRKNTTVPEGSSDWITSNESTTIEDFRIFVAKSGGSGETFRPVVNESDEFQSWEKYGQAFTINSTSSKHDPHQAVFTPDGSRLVWGKPPLHAVVYTFNETKDNWEQLGDVIEDPDDGEGFASGVSTNSDATTIAVRAHGATKVFTRQSSTTPWIQLGETIQPENVSEDSVNISADVNISLLALTHGGSDVVYVYQRDVIQIDKFSVLVGGKSHEILQFFNLVESMYNSSGKNSLYLTMGNLQTFDQMLSSQPLWTSQAKQESAFMSLVLEMLDIPYFHKNAKKLIRRLIVGDSFEDLASFRPSHDVLVAVIGLFRAIHNT